jgi:hypothetical protein
LFSPPCIKVFDYELQFIELCFKKMHLENEFKGRVN